jgi:hypothetical protein
MMGQRSKDAAMYSSLYSQAVLRGLLKYGMAVGDVAKVIRLPLASVKKILAGEAGLADKHLDRIESVTGKSAGQIALLSVDNPGESIVALMDASAAARIPVSKVLS